MPYKGFLGQDQHLRSTGPDFITTLYSVCWLQFSFRFLQSIFQTTMAHRSSSSRKLFSLLFRRSAPLLFLYHISDAVLRPQRDN